MDSIDWGGVVVLREALYRYPLKMVKMVKMVNIYKMFTKYLHRNLNILQNIYTKTL